MLQTILGGPPYAWLLTPAILRKVASKIGLGPDRTDRDERNALHLCGLNQQEEATSTLIKSGINVNAEGY